MSTSGKLWSSVAAAVLLLVGLFWWMNRGYDRVSEPGYQFGMALMSVCNRKDSQRLQILVDQVESSRDASNLPPADARVLLAIAERAEAGKWEAADREIRQLMKDQTLP